MPIAEDPSPRPADDSPDDPFDGLVLDEEFVRGASVKEASGRARMLGAKWKRQPPQDVPWRAEADRTPQIRRRRFGRRATRVDSWGRSKRRSRTWQAPLFIALAAAVTLAALNVDRLREWYQNRQDSSAAGTPNRAPLPTLPPETAAPTAAPPAADPDTPTVDRPWAGSPAEQWPAGPDALVLPQATAVGVFGADEVAAQLALVKQFMVAANLDPAQVRGGSPDAAVSLLDRESGSWLAASVAHPDAEHDPTTYLSRFDPLRTVLATDQIKVQGRFSFESDGEQGVVVHTDVTYVYALRPGPDAGKKRPDATGAAGSAKPVAWSEGGAGPEVQREIIRRVLDFRFYNPARFKVQPGKLRPGKGNSDFGNNICDLTSGFLEPPFDLSAPSSESPGPTGPESDPYDRSKPLERHEGCGTVSRT
ncbi:hypothetical protein OG871_17620 [Kitasatospora sp. NBC_00374]|uniref:SCO2583/SCO2584 N-terminal domain-containing protein n=1 Tax=Kitasatospora sp. NBC_00374 TaxID=2975964 RepID=UPI0030E03BBD